MGLLVHLLLPFSTVLSRISPPGPQKGCRRQAWHTAGWVGAGSQLGPENRDLGFRWHLVPLGELTEASSKLTVVLRTAPWGPRCCLNICPQSFTLHCQYHLLTGAGPTPKELTGLVIVTPRGGPSPDMSRMGIQVSPSVQNREESTQMPKGRLPQVT